MDTRFEINIKQVGIKGDDKALYLFHNDKIILKLEYKDIEAAVNYLIGKANQKQLSSTEKPSLPVVTIDNDD